MMSFTLSFTMQPIDLCISDLRTIAAKYTTHSLSLTRHTLSLLHHLTIGHIAILFPFILVLNHIKNRMDWPKTRRLITVLIFVGKFHCSVGLFPNMDRVHSLGVVFTVISSCDSSLAIFSSISLNSAISSLTRLSSWSQPLFHGRTHHQQLALHLLNFLSSCPHSCRVFDDLLIDFGYFPFVSSQPIIKPLIRPFWRRFSSFSIGLYLL